MTVPGLQSIYLAEISPDFAELLIRLLREAGNALGTFVVTPPEDKADQMRRRLEHALESEIQQSALAETEKEQLIKARRGQGRFRDNVQQTEKRCRVTGVEDTRFLIASHIKPWRSSTNPERLDGENGLLLAPTIDFLFDRGFLSFEDNGALLISPVVEKETMAKLGVPTQGIVSVGPFTPKQSEYLAFHRREVFLEAGRES